MESRLSFLLSVKEDLRKVICRFGRYGFMEAVRHQRDLWPGFFFVLKIDWNS